VLHSGDKIKAKIVSLEGGRVSLSLKALKEDPWLKIESVYQVGQKVRAKVIKIRTGGVFVELAGPVAEDGTSSEIIGFLPLAEFGGKSPSEAVEVGKEYDMAIVSIDAKEHKLTLTLEKEKTE
jgi:small subunit ribosomal protein S1